MNRQASANIPAAWKRRATPPRQLAGFISGQGGKLIVLAPLDGNNLARDPVTARVEAVLLASHEPVSPRKLMKFASLPDTGEVRRRVQHLSELLRKGGSSFYVEEIAGGYQLLTRPELRPLLESICRIQSDVPLSGPMLETLAIIAYRQPICRADIEAIRGVQVGEILRHLLDKSLIRLAGKDDSLGRPFLYGTTPRFLQHFGLRNLHELPMVESLAKPAGALTPKPTEVSEADADDPETGGVDPEELDEELAEDAIADEAEADA